MWNVVACPADTRFPSGAESPAPQRWPRMSNPQSLGPVTIPRTLLRQAIEETSSSLLPNDQHPPSTRRPNLSPRCRRPQILRQGWNDTPSAKCDRAKSPASDVGATRRAQLAYLSPRNGSASTRSYAAWRSPPRHSLFISHESQVGCPRPTPACCTFSGTSRIIL